MPESLKQIRQRLRDLRARTGNAVIELGGSEPAEGVPEAGGLYHIDQAVAGLTEHIEAGYNTPDDLGAEPAPEPEPTPGVDEVLSVDEFADRVEVVVGYDADAAASITVAAWRGPDLPNIDLIDPPNPATLSIPRESVDVETRIAVVRRDSDGGFVSEDVLQTIIVPALAGSTDPDPEPTPDPDPSGALVVDDPDSFSSSAEVRANGYDRTSIIHLDTQVARPGGSKSIRYDYVDQGVDSPIHVGRRLDLPARLKEIWLETQVRWSDNFFAIQSPPTTPGWTFAHKFLFLEVKSQQPEPWLASDGTKMFRWAVMWPGGGSSNPPHATIKYESPGLDPDATQPSGMDTSGGVAHLHTVDAAQFFDDQWHQFRMHIRHDPGLMEITVDGQSIGRMEGMVIHPEADIVSVLLGRNKDDGIESGTESLWWGRTVAHDTDPGWGI